MAAVLQPQQDEVLPGVPAGNFYTWPNPICGLALNVADDAVRLQQLATSFGPDSEAGEAARRIAESLQNGLAPALRFLTGTDPRSAWPPSAGHSAMADAYLASEQTAAKALAITAVATRDNVACRDMLALVGYDAELAAIGMWDDVQVLQACEWAAATHVHASDNDDVVAPPRPTCLAGEPWTGPEQGEGVFTTNPTPIKAPELFVYHFDDCMYVVAADEASAWAYVDAEVGESQDRTVALVGTLAQACADMPVETANTDEGEPSRVLAAPAAFIERLEDGESVPMTLAMDRD
jgi:hypothetical protein